MSFLRAPVCHWQIGTGIRTIFLDFHFRGNDKKTKNKTGGAEMKGFFLLLVAGAMIFGGCGSSGKLRTPSGETEYKGWGSAVELASAEKISADADKVRSEADINRAKAEAIRQIPGLAPWVTSVDKTSGSWHSYSSPWQGDLNCQSFAGAINKGVAQGRQSSPPVVKAERIEEATVKEQPSNFSEE